MPREQTAGLLPFVFADPCGPGACPRHFPFILRTPWAGGACALWVRPWAGGACALWVCPRHFPFILRTPWAGGACARHSRRFLRTPIAAPVGRDALIAPPTCTASCRGRRPRRPVSDFASGYSGGASPSPTGTEIGVRRNPENAGGEPPAHKVPHITKNSAPVWERCFIWHAVRDSNPCEACRCAACSAACSASLKKCSAF